ncbi:EAL domain-containing protein [Aquincola sp. S2]|uniref:EAL domain-containing protein n=1 Tax=Pseudaquabacterium terrae TaxID=2732868 RepID=A0ABX2EJQ0_9BURK|nr:EAL domain-containing protein [Aquabacterium terrae]NRF68797.1 EAL domain-containing protein [Aquabacterium terrae]
MLNASLPTSPTDSIDLKDREGAIGRGTAAGVLFEEAVEGLALSASARLAAMRSFLRQLYGHADYCVLLLGLDGEIMWENATATRFLAAEFDTLQGRLFGELLGPDPRRYENVMGLNRLLSGALTSLRHEAELHNPRGEERVFEWWHTRVDPGTWGLGEEFACLTVGFEITMQKAEERRLVGLADRDPLTGLYNRRRFEENFEKILTRASRYNHGVALLYFDIDNFKLINDLSGHKVGDEIIQKVSQVLKESIRATDLPVRQGGDEFAVVMDEVDIDVVHAAVAQFSERLSNVRFRRNDRLNSISCSIGVALYPEHGSTVGQLMANADMAMYRAKSESRSSTNWVIYDPSFTDLQMLSEQVKWKDRLQTALREERLLLFYQPIQQLKDGRITHCEALMRMIGEDGHLVLPGAFIAHAEHTGLINQLDRRGVDIALMHMSQMLVQGRKPRVSVNVSTKTLQAGGFCEFLQQRLRDSNVPGELLTIEITETAAIEGIEKMAELLHRISALGCQFSLDDFGAGFSSWLNLRKLPISFLKIDGSFVRHVTDSPDDPLFVRAINEVSQGLNIKTVAECVEDRQTLNTLKSLGVDYVQGFLIGRPMQRLSDIFK